MNDMTEPFRTLGEEILDLAVEKHQETQGMFDPDTGQPLDENHYEDNFVPGSNNWNEVKEALGPDLPDRFASYGLPDPDKFQPLLENLSAALERLESNESTYIHSDTLELSEWQGVAMEKFKQNYIAPWYDKLQAHRELVASLRETIAQNQKLFADTQVAVRNIGETAKEALGEVRGYSSPWSGKDSFDIAMSVAGLVVAVAASDSNCRHRHGCAGHSGSWSRPTAARNPNHRVQERDGRPRRGAHQVV